MEISFSKELNWFKLCDTTKRRTKKTTSKNKGKNSSLPFFLFVLLLCDEPERCRTEDSVDAIHRGSF